MIRTATQLKAKVRNLSSGDSKKAQTLIRNFIMERFLERIALSQYRNNFILKGGMLVAGSVTRKFLTKQSLKRRFLQQAQSGIRQIRFPALGIFFPR